MSPLIYSALFLLSFTSCCVSGLRYNYGDGSYYIGEVDENGKPSGKGNFYNTSGALGR